MKSVPIDGLPALTRDEMAEVDRAMIADYGIDLVRMMEVAGRALARLAQARNLSGNALGHRVTVLAGPGGNGGGALVAARNLANWGAEVAVHLLRAPGAMTPVPAAQARILKRLGLRTEIGAPQGDAGDLVIDGILGYGLEGAPRPDAAALISWANGTSVPVLALDLPSGLDATSGEAATPTIQADATLTLALPKQGLVARDGPAHAGTLYLADIGVPPRLYEAVLGRGPGPLFATGDILRLG